MLELDVVHRGGHAESACAPDLVQVTAALAVYEDLFREEGAELYLKPLSRYLPLEGPRSVTFAELCAAAIARGESCIGVRVVAHELDRAQQFGIHINPDKARAFTLGPDDRLITLPEDDT